MDTLQLSVVLPAYNEEDNLEQGVQDILAFLRSRSLPSEVIVVNDGSTDGTGAITQKLSETYPEVKPIQFSSNRGYGRALSEGFKAARGDLVFFTDSDRQFAIEDLGLLLAHIPASDIVVGYRAPRHDPFLRILASRVFNMLARPLFNLKVRDVDCAFKIFRREVFDKIEIHSTRFMVNTEILAKARLYNMKIVEVPVRHLPRLGGRSSVGFGNVSKTLREMVGVYQEVQRLKKKAVLP